METKLPLRVSQKDMKNLEDFISAVDAISPRAQQALLWFLRQSDYLERPIVTTIPYHAEGTDEEAFANEVAAGVEALWRLYPARTLAGSSKILSHETGVAIYAGEKKIVFQKVRPNVAKNAQGHTIWLSETPQQKQDINLIDFKFRIPDLMEIDLGKGETYDLQHEG